MSYNARMLDRLRTGPARRVARSAAAHVDHLAVDAEELGDLPADLIGEVRVGLQAHPAREVAPAEGPRRAAEARAHLQDLAAEDELAPLVFHRGAYARTDAVI